MISCERNPEVWERLVGLTEEVVESSPRQYSELRHFTHLALHIDRAGEYDLILQQVRLL